MTSRTAAQRSWDRITDAGPVQILDGPTHSTIATQEHPTSEAPDSRFERDRQLRLLGIETRAYNPAQKRVGKGYKTGGQFLSLADRVMSDLKAWLDGGATHPDPLAEYSQPQLKTAATKLGLNPPKGMKYVPLKGLLMTHGRSQHGSKLDPSDPEQKARDRQAEIDKVRGVAEVAAEVHELLGNETDPDATRRSLKAIGQRHGVDTVHLQDLADPTKLREAADEMAKAAKLTRIGSAGEPTSFDRKQHEGIAGPLRDGQSVEVVRPGYSARLADGEQVQISKAKVEAADRPVPKTGIRQGQMDERRERLRALSGQRPTGIEPLRGGHIADVEVLTYSDGTKVVRKSYTGPAARLRGTNESEDAEELAPLVLDTVGLRSAATIRGSDGVIYMEYVPGKTGYSVVVPDTITVPGRILESEEGRRLGLADTLMGLGDRSNPGNWMVTPDGHLVGIDHGTAFMSDAAGNPFARRYYDARTGTYRRNTLTRAELAGLRQRLTDLKPEFERLGRGEWHDEMMARLDRVAERAPAPAKAVKKAAPSKRTPTKATPDDGLDDMSDHSLGSLAAEFDMPKASEKTRAQHLAYLRRQGVVSPAVRQARLDAEDRNPVGATTPLSSHPLTRATQIQNRIRTAYVQVLKEHGRKDGGWVTLAELRDQLGPEVSRDELDNALRIANRMKGTRIVPESNQKALTDREEGAHVVIGRQRKHLIAIKDPAPMSSSEFADEVRKVTEPSAARPVEPTKPPAFVRRAGAALADDEAVRAVAHEPSSDAVRAAIDSYGGEGTASYQQVNDALRGGRAYGVTSHTPEQRAVVDGLDRAMREAPGTPRDLVTYRFVTPETFGEGLTHEQLAQGDMTGLEWRDGGFVSTGASSEWASQTSEIAMRILVPKGTKAISHSRRTADGGGLDLDEILLDRGLRFRVVADHGYRRRRFDGTPDPYSGRDLDVEVLID